MTDTPTTPTPTAPAPRPGITISNPLFYGLLLLVGILLFTWQELQDLLWGINEKITHLQLKKSWGPLTEGARLPVIIGLIVVEGFAIALALRIFLRVLRLLALPKKKRKAEGPRFIWAERWNAPIYAIVITFGVPLMAVLVTDFYVKVAIAAAWFGVWTQLYTFLEGREIVGQMIGRGSIKSVQAGKQSRSAHFPFVGVLLAIFVWGIGVSVYAALHWPGGGFFDDLGDKLSVLWEGCKNTRIYYGIIEWGIIIHTLFVWKTDTVMFDLILDEFQHLSRGERLETNVS